jgi:hypothetical protein
MRIAFLAASISFLVVILLGSITTLIYPPFTILTVIVLAIGVFVGVFIKTLVINRKAHE